MTSRASPASTVSSGASTTMPMIAWFGCAAASIVASAAASVRPGASASARLRLAGSRRLSGEDVTGPIIRASALIGRCYWFAGLEDDGAARLGRPLAGVRDAVDFQAGRGKEVDDAP